MKELKAEKKDHYSHPPIRVAIKLFVGKHLHFPVSFLFLPYVLHGSEDQPEMGKGQHKVVENPP
jgi:hypothetical protein